MKKIYNHEAMERRCKKLESLGFEIHHEDSRVNVYRRAIVDFSAIAEEHFLEYAVKQVFEEGLKVGESTLQTKFKVLMGVK